MHTSRLTLIAAIAAFASAQSIPTCANSCISSALPASCNLDPSCICADASFISDISCCVSTACDTSGQEAALQYAKSICAPVGVTTLPTAASCASSASSTGSSSGSSTAASTSATSTAAGGAGSTGSSGSASKTASSTGSTASSTASSTGSSASSTKAASSAASAASSAASSAAATGAAGHLAVQGMGVVGAVLGAVALI